MTACKFCNADLKTEEQIFSNGTKHLKLTCLSCERHNGYAPQFKDYKDFIMPIGKYKNKKIEDINSIDPDYLRWAAENMNNNIQRKIEAYFDEQYEKRKQI